MFVLLFINNINHIPVENMRIGSDGADKLKLPKKNSIEMGNAANNE